MKNKQDWGEIDGLNDVIINLHKELRQYDKKVKRQNMIINIQWDIIACLMELKGVIEDE